MKRSRSIAYSNDDAVFRPRGRQRVLPQLVQRAVQHNTLPIYGPEPNWDAIDQYREEQNAIRFNRLQQQEMLQRYKAQHYQTTASKLQRWARNKLLKSKINRLYDAYFHPTVGPHMRKMKNKYPFLSSWKIRKRTMLQYAQPLYSTKGYYKKK